VFIAFEGIDGCGKSTLSKKFAELRGITWTKEPSFSSEKADQMNLRTGDDAGREAEFIIDRVIHQGYLRGYQPLVCDRYIWSGLAYCKVYSPQFFPLLERLYCHPFFDKPDYYVFVDTPIDLCMERAKRVQTREKLEELRASFHSLRPLIQKDSHVIVVSSQGSIESLIESLWKQIQALEGENSEIL
jgi:dTMP kinase